MICPDDVVGYFDVDKVNPSILIVNEEDKIFWNLYLSLNVRLL
jgi:hypothetical protein